MKNPSKMTSQALYQRRQKFYRSATQQGIKLAAAAHPATGGNLTLCLNWGNAASRASWQATEAKIEGHRLLYEAAYSLALHREHPKTSKPLWCPHCKELDLVT